MSKKYFDTKTGSLEEKITRIATEQQSIRKPEPNVKLNVKSYFDVKEGSLAATAAKVVSEETEYQAKFKKELEKTGKSVGQMSDAEKKTFFNKIDKMHKAKNEAVMPDDKGEKINQMKHQKAKEGEKDIIKPISEDDMEKFHQMQKDGKSAEQIAKALGLDVKSVAKLMDLDEGRMKDIATNQSELERLTKRLSDLRSQKSATSDKEQKAKLAKDILQTQKSVADVRLSMKEANVLNPYAVGMAQAMKQKNDKPPLEKSTITKAHDIAKSIMKKEEVCPKCGKDHGSKINASNCMGESKKTFSDLRNETKEIQLGDKGKTLTGKKAAVIDVEPRQMPI